jgi:hypothetical protein
MCVLWGVEGGEFEARPGSDYRKVLSVPVKGARGPLHPGSTTHRTLDWLQFLGTWHTTAGIANDLSAPEPNVKRALYRLYHRGLVTRRLSETRNNTGSNFAEWRAV